MVEPGLNFIPPSMEFTPLLREEVDLNSTAQEHTAYAGQALAESSPPTEPFSLLHWYS